MRGRHGDALAGEPQRRVHDPCPGERAEAPPELVEARGDAGHRAGGCADEVVDELLAERDGQLLELGLLPRAAESRHRHEEVENPRPVAARVQPEGEAAAREPRHHGLRDTGGERGGDGGVRGGPAVGEPLEAGFRRGRMAGRYAGGYGHLC